MFGPISEFSIQLTQWFQGLADGVVLIMNIFTEMGTQEFYMIFLGVFVWLISYNMGARLAIMVLGSGALNYVLKLSFHTPRPTWLHPELETKVWENSFGLPSGHAQTPMASYGLLIPASKRRWVKITVGLTIFMIGISRIALGAHFIEDTLTGWLAGAILLWLFLKYEGAVLSWFTKKSIPMQYALSLLFSLGIILMGMLAIAATANWQLPQIWVENASNSPLAEEVFNPMSLEGVITPAGALFGGLAGIIWFTQQGKFNNKGKVWQYFARFLIGVIGMLGIWMGLDLLFPDNGDLLSYILRFVRYGAVGFWTIGIAPWLFIKFKLAEFK